MTEPRSKPIRRSNGDSREAVPVPDLPGFAGVILLLLLIAVSHLYPQAAFPMHAISIGFGLLLAMTLGLFRFLSRAERIPVSTWIPAALSIAFAGWLLLRLRASPLPASGMEECAGAVLFAISFTAAWSLFAVPPDPAAPAPPERTMLRFHGGILSGIALFAIYQAIGPEGWPRTFATMHRDILEFLPEDARFREGVLHALQEKRASGTVGSPNIFAGYTAMAAWLCAGAALLMGGVRRALWVVALLLCLAGIYLSGSRGGLLAFAAGGVLFAALLLSQRKWLRAAAAAPLLLLALLPARALAEPSAPAQRWLGTSTVQQRLYYWETAAEIWSEAPILGRGPGAYEVLYPAHRVDGSGETQYAHNWFLQLGTTGGVVGLLLFIGAIGGSVRALRSPPTVVRTREDAIIRAALLAAGMTLLLHGLVDFSLSMREGMLNIGMLFGTLVGLHTRDAAQWHAKPVSIPIARVVAILSAPVAIAVALWFVQVRPGLADHHARIAQEKFEEKSPITDILTHADRAIEWQPGRASLFQQRAMYRRAAQMPGVREDLLRAAELAPHSAAVQEALAWHLLETGDPAGAILHSTRATELHPLDPTHWMAKARIHWTLNQPEEARAALAEAGKRKRLNRMEEDGFLQLSELIGLPPASP